MAVWKVTNQISKMNVDQQIAQQRGQISLMMCYWELAWRSSYWMNNDNKSIKVSLKVREITFLGCPKKWNMVGWAGGEMFQFHSISRSVINEIKFEDPKNGHLKKLQVVPMHFEKSTPMMFLNKHLDIFETFMMGIGSPKYWSKYEHDKGWKIIKFQSHYQIRNFLQNLWI